MLNLPSDWWDYIINLKSHPETHPPLGPLGWVNLDIFLFYGTFIPLPTFYMWYKCISALGRQMRLGLYNIIIILNNYINLMWLGRQADYYIINILYYIYHYFILYISLFYIIYISPPSPPNLAEIWWGYIFYYIYYYLLLFESGVMVNTVYLG
jgi:hypothetical protein